MPFPPSSHPAPDPSSLAGLGHRTTTHLAMPILQGAADITWITVTLPMDGPIGTHAPVAGIAQQARRPAGGVSNA